MLDRFTFCINYSQWEIVEISNEEMSKLIGYDIKESFTHGVTRYSENIIYVNKESPEKKRTLYHELTHCFMYEYGHNQQEKEFNNEDVCEIAASSHDFTEEIVKEYFKIDNTKKKV